ncbi:putative transposase [Allorhodopirellula solitaria]|uniref:Putative transposase n=2 Tax=Allorhodopirellula solitaria TaxID=2527987 RepID=A0A5C5XNV8_9BACT|nr:putative transposase [Allorhodopirellula solitaria]
MAPPDSNNSDRHYLVDAINLRDSFRKSAISHLKRLRERGELKLDTDSEFGDLREDAAWESLVEHLSSLDWVSYIQPPPSGSSGPQDLVRYLTRYLTGGPISNSRIVAADEHEVTFMARQGKKQGGESQQVPVTLTTLDFMRSWCLHIQPDQLTKTRYFGGWSNSQLASYQQRCADDINTAEFPYAADAIEFPPQYPEATEPRSTQPTCPHCEQSTLRVVSTYPRPSWREIFSRGSTTAPPWYAGSLQDSDRVFWDSANGEGFYDWYLKHQVEGAYAGSAAMPVPLSTESSQLMLPGLESGGYYAIE